MEHQPQNIFKPKGTTPEEILQEWDEFLKKYTTIPYHSILFSNEGEEEE